MASISEMLKTEDVAESERMVDALIQMASSQIIQITILIDPRKNSAVSLSVNREVSSDQAFEILDLARKELIRLEREANKT